MFYPNRLNADVAPAEAGQVSWFPAFAGHGKESMFYTYILKSLKDGRRYIGHTNNLEVRLKFHNNGANPSTKNRRPLELACFKAFDTKLEAARYERYLKSLKGGKQLELEMSQMLKNADVAQLVEQLHGKE